MEVEIIRAFERLIIVLFAGTSIILGWHLFKIGVVSPQSGEFSGKGFKFTLQKVGPGVFFSLFGSVILSISLVYGFKVVKTKNTPTGNYKTEYSLVNTIQESDLRRITVSINSLDLIDVDNSSRYENNRNAIKIAIERLRAYRDVLAQKKFSAGRLNEYIKCRDGKESACKLSGSYKEIEAWLTDTILQ